MATDNPKRPKRHNEVHVRPTNACDEHNKRCAFSWFPACSLQETQHQCSDVSECEAVRLTRRSSPQSGKKPITVHFFGARRQNYVACKKLLRNINEAKRSHHNETKIRKRPRDTRTQKKVATHTLHTRSQAVFHSRTRSVNTTGFKIDLPI